MGLLWVKNIHQNLGITFCFPLSELLELVEFQCSLTFQQNYQLLERINL